MPPCHEINARRYPYILLMHGSVQSDTHWDNLGLDEALARGVALGRLPPLALVLPFGGSLANLNTFGPSASWGAVVLDELVPHLEATYCLTQGEREQRAIGGISRGGFWAFVIALRHPEVFGAVGGHSAFFDLFHAPPTHNPLDLALATPPDPPLRIWLDRGRNDHAQVNLDLMSERLTSNGIDHIYARHPVGQHNDLYWAAYLEDYLRFYSAPWTANVTELPACELAEVDGE
ncbi:MAG: esterase family protein [Anaerolineae bacterium]|nr:esterase family protein [Anaerolineae bacterium]